MLFQCLEVSAKDCAGDPYRCSTYSAKQKCLDLYQLIFRKPSFLDWQQVMVCNDNRGGQQQEQKNYKEDQRPVHKDSTDNFAALKFCPPGRSLKRFVSEKSRFLLSRFVAVEWPFWIRYIARHWTSLSGNALLLG